MSQWRVDDCKTAIFDIKNLIRNMEMYKTDNKVYLFVNSQHIISKTLILKWKSICVKQQQSRRGFHSSPQAWLTHAHIHLSLHCVGTSEVPMVRPRALPGVSANISVCMWQREQVKHQNWCPWSFYHSITGGNKPKRWNINKKLKSCVSNSINWDVMSQ